MDIQIGVVVAQAINIGILFFLFRLLFSKKLTQILAEKRKKEAQLKYAQEEYKKMLEQAKTEKKQIIDEARQRAIDLIKDMESIALTKSNKIISDAEKQAEQIIDGGKKELVKERLAMRQDIKNHILNMAVKLNAKVFSERGYDKKFFEMKLAEIEAS